MKIKKITVQNFKSVSNETANFDGCSAIITAGNNKGKTSFLRGMIDRFRGEKPDVIVKQGESEGSQVMELTDGAKIEWNFSDKQEKFSYITKDGIKMTSGVIKSIGEKYFGLKFDIDKFLNSQPKQQVRELQRLVGLDFTEIDERYKLAYELRTEANRERDRLKSINRQKPEKVEKPDIDTIKNKIDKIRSENEKTRQEIDQFNREQEKRKYTIENASSQLMRIENEIENSMFQSCFDSKRANELLDKLPEPQPENKYDFIDISEAEAELDEANQLLRKYDSYERDLEDYNQWVEDFERAKENAENADKKVKDIEKERMEMIASANIPREFEINEDGIYYNGLPLDDNQISSSGKYIAALKLGLLVLGEIRTMHFDASFLDNISLSEIQAWASENDLQLLIERPDLEGGDIKYEVIEK